MTREDLAEMRRDAESPEIRDEFRRSAQAVRRWERDHPQDLASVLNWIEPADATVGLRAAQLVRNRQLLAAALETQTPLAAERWDHIGVEVLTDWPGQLDPETGRDLPPSV